MAETHAFTELALPKTPADQGVVNELARTWYADELAAPVPVDAAELAEYDAGREQCIGAVALLWMNLDRRDPRQEQFLQMKIRRLESLGRGPENLGPIERALAEETANEVVLLTLGLAASEYERLGLGRLAFHDALTGAQNRNGELRLCKSWIRPTPARRRGEEAPKKPRRALLAIDMANFKRINDLLGDKIGDQVLIETVLEIEDLTRGDGREVVRPGGDDFWVYINDITRAGFRRLLERVKTAQDAKVANGRNQALWVAIGFFKGAVERRGEVFRPSVEARDQNDPESERMLCVNGRQIAPLRHLLVYAIGGAHGQVSTTRAYNGIKRKAFLGMKEHKERLHEAMGGADRTHRVEFVFNEIPDEEQSNITIEQFGDNSGEPIDRYVIELDLTGELPTTKGITRVEYGEHDPTED